MALLIRNGEIVTVGSRFQADIYVENETITRIGKDIEAPPNTEIIDATGKLVFPGFIDPHVHIYLPFMATFAKDTHETGSIAALIGGTTAYIEMCCPNRNDDALEGYQLWKSKADGKSACDYAFHMSVTKFVKETESQLRQIVADGTASFKLFLAYKNFFGDDDAEMYQTLELAKRLGVIVTAHCENAELVARLQQKLLADGRTGPEWHEPSRPESVEAEGTKHVMSPPLRAKRNQAVLWDALALGSIDTVGTDHCPFDTEQKLLGKDSFVNIPNGIPGIEDRVNLLYTHGVKSGRLELDRFVDAASTRAAKLFGLFPRKGTIAVGSDADLVVYDTNYRGVVSAKSQHVNNDYNGFEGMEIAGRPSVVTVRGMVQVRDGKFVGERGRGEMLKRGPSHF